MSFTLPAGSSVDEDSGDLVVKDSSGTIVFRRNESAGEWQFEGTNITGVNSIDTSESVTVSGDDTITLGRNHGATVQGDNVVVGVGATALEDVNSTVSGNDPRKVAVGYDAAQNHEQFATVATGFEAARDATSNSLTAVGYRAAKNSSGRYVCAIGRSALKDNTGIYTAAFGNFTGESNTGDRVSAFGDIAAYRNTGEDVAALGFGAAQDNTGDDITVFGWYAGKNNTGNRTIAIGSQSAGGQDLADPATMGDDNIGIGEQAIKNNQASGLIAIGQDAGINAQTDDQLIITQRDGTRRLVMDLTTGDLEITGELIENKTL